VDEEASQRPKAKVQKARPRRAKSEAGCWIAEVGSAVGVGNLRHLRSLLVPERFLHSAEPALSLSNGLRSE